MKGTIISIIAVLAVLGGVFFAGFSISGCVQYPKIREDETPACADYKVCMYYVAAGKLTSNCNAEFLRCCKARDFDMCKHEKNRPADMKFQECWDKLQ
jgi:hypothetical protein